MKKILLILIFAASSIYSQYSIPLRLVTSSGTPNTGQAANIVFTRSPHVYGTNNVTGLTVTEVGTAGNYRVRGFTTFETVKLWLSGVEQTWFDSVQVGSIYTFLNTYYLNLATTQTITGAKTTTGAWSNSGTWTWTAGSQILFNPFISASATWITDYSIPSSRSLIWKDYGDSIYGIKKWYMDGFKVRMLTGYKLYGQTSTTPPISIDVTDLSYTGDQLGVGDRQDSTAFPKITVMYDSTDVSENEFAKSYTLELNQYKGTVADSFDVNVHYQRTTNGALISEQYSKLQNTAYTGELILSQNITSTSTVYDTLILPKPGLYKISVNVTVNFQTDTGTETDSIWVELDDGAVGGASRIDKSLSTHVYNGTVNTGGAITVPLTGIYYVSGYNNVFYVMVKSGSTGGFSHQVWRSKWDAILVW